MRRFQLDTRSWWRIIAGLFGIMVLMNAFEEQLGALEGRLFPVKDHVVIEEINVENPETTLISGKATKHRLGCELQQVRWYLIRKDGESVRAELSRRGKPSFTTDDGEFIFRNWAVQLPADDVLNHSLAIAVHTCHPIFPTLSIFYRSPGVVARNVKSYLKE